MYLSVCTLYVAFQSPNLPPSLPFPSPTACFCFHLESDEPTDFDGIRANDNEHRNIQQFVEPRVGNRTQADISTIQDLEVVLGLSPPPYRAGQLQIRRENHRIVKWQHSFKHLAAKSWILRL